MTKCKYCNSKIKKQAKGKVILFFCQNVKCGLVFKEIKEDKKG